jgi:hypothetical protein
MQRQLIDPPVRQSTPQSGLIDRTAGVVPGNIEVPTAAAPATEAPANKPRAPRKPKAEKAPVPPAAPPAPAPVAEKPKPKAAKKVAPAPAAPGPETSPALKAKLVKGSEEAKAYMAKLREAAKAKKAAVTAASKTPEGGSEVDDWGGEAPAKKKVVRKKIAKGDKIAMAKFYDNASKDMSEIRKSIIAIRNDQNMPGDQKKEEIDRLKIIIGEIARQMESARLDVKKQFAASQ